MSESSAQATETVGCLQNALARLDMKTDAQLSFDGLLSQIWTPEGDPDGLGNLLLRTKGRPFHLSGQSDSVELLTLFRFASACYQFSTDSAQPALQGAVGRVMRNGQPETCANVQGLNKSFYHRQPEAVECNVNCMMVLPFWRKNPVHDGARPTGGPMGVAEFVLQDKAVDFKELFLLVASCLESEGFMTCDISGLQLLSSSDVYDILASMGWSSSQSSACKIENPKETHLAELHKKQIGPPNRAICSAVRMRLQDLIEDPEQEEGEKREETKDAWSKGQDDAASVGGNSSVIQMQESLAQMQKDMTAMKAEILRCQFFQFASVVLLLALFISHSLSAL